MPLTLLIGGGRDIELLAGLLGPFRDAVGDAPVCVFTAGETVAEADEMGERAGLACLRAGVPETVVVRLQPGANRVTYAARVEGCGGVAVAGGLTPLYAELLVPVGDLFAELPYAGFSAGAAVAATRAIVGGWRDEDLELCPEEASEDLDQLTVVPGLGRVPFAVDVHAREWGTIPRAARAVERGLVPEAYAIDEHTALDGETRAVTGAGRAHYCT